jgi:hypothetical protein
LADINDNWNAYSGFHNVNTQKTEMWSTADRPTLVNIKLSYSNHFISLRFNVFKKDITHILAGTANNTNL